jgi:hypothetical protein
MEKRLNKIALIGARGYERTAPQRVDCFAWEKLPSNLNLRDYDTVIIDLLSLPSKNSVDWLIFEQILSLSVAIDILKSSGQVILIGDPRFSIPVKGSPTDKERPFLFWTGLTFVWENQSGDTNIIDDHYAFRQYQEYLKSLKKWSYSLKHCQIDYGGLKAELRLEDWETEKVQLNLQAERLCQNRYGNALALRANLSFQTVRAPYSGREIETLFRFGPIILLPETELDEDQTIVTVLRDLCGVESEVPEPEWVTKILAPGQKEIDDEIREIRAKLESLLADLALAEKKRDKSRTCLKLLFERGIPLETAVREVLRALGAHVEDPEEVGKEDGWITIQAGGIPYEGVLEIKSTRNAQFGEDGIRQLLDWVNRGIQMRQKRYKPIFIGNNAVEKPLNERPWPFSDNWRKSADIGQIAALTSNDLYFLYLLASAGKLKRDDFWQDLFSKNGIFDIAPYINMPSPTENRSTP